MLKDVILMWIKAVIVGTKQDSHTINLGGTTGSVPYGGSLSARTVYPRRSPFSVHGAIERELDMEQHLSTILIYLQDLQIAVILARCSKRSDHLLCSICVCWTSAVANGGKDQRTYWEILGSSVGDATKYISMASFLSFYVYPPKNPNPAITVPLATFL